MITSVHFGGFHFFRKMASQTGTSAFIMSSETDRANKKDRELKGVMQEVAASKRCPGFCILWYED